MEALAERVGVLERTVSGGAAFPRPPRREGSSGSGRAEPPPSDDAPPPTEARTTGDDSEPPTAKGGSADVGSRPSIGAVRRRQQAEPTTYAPVAAAEEPGPVEEPAPIAPASPAPALVAASIDRDTLTEAWGDGILQSLPARAKARFASGRFVAVDEQGAHFALPHAAHRDQCAEQLSIVESALEQHFGTKVKLVLVVDDEAPPPRAGATASRRDTSTRADGVDREGSGDEVEEAQDIDPSDLAASPEAGEDQASAAQARLMEAFPGASEVVG
jgi:hypothetical protein